MSLERGGSVKITERRIKYLRAAGGAGVPDGRYALGFMKSGWFSTRKTQIVLCSVGILLILSAAGWWLFREPSLDELAEQVQAKVAAIRGREYKQATRVRQITFEQSRQFLREQLATLPKIDHYWAVVRTLGLYRGPDLGAPELLFEDLFNLAAGAYDSGRKEMLVAWDLDRAAREVLLSHELCHALQDQHFDLDRYFVGLTRTPGANADEILARQSVVEGEATFVDAIYQAQSAGVADPNREQIAQVLANDGSWKPDLWDSWLTHPDLTEKDREQLRLAIATRDKLPPFLFESFMEAYIDGAKFIHAVHEGGWKEVDLLYGSRAPISTEQILHPEKWRAGETYARIEWPAFDDRFAEWRLLDQNSLGEKQWRAVFRAQGLPKLAESAAAGWNGDRYAVFRHRDHDNMLLLMFTVWDSPAEAAEFAEAYRRALGTKNRGQAVPTRLVAQDQAVWMVEGGDEGSLDGFADFIAGAQWYDSRP